MRIKKSSALVVLAACGAIALLWQAGRFFITPPSSPALRPASFYPAATAEPIMPIPRSLALDGAKIALGKRLFHDAGLSRDGSVACASCHRMARGGADGAARSVGIGGQLTDRNSPTVFNTVFNFAQFWDGRAATLEEQIDGPLHNPKEMASSWPAVMAKLAEDAGYRAAFERIYGGITPEHVKNAIAEFERSLITPGARFDRYLEGDTKAVTPAELKGYQLFKTYGCIACHQGVNVGGNLYQRLGVLYGNGEGGAITQSPDVGRMAVTGKPEDFLVFKVPGLRNVALTAPYFHDGSVATLEQAVVLMGQYQLGVAIPSSDVGLIVQFLHTLTADVEAKAP
jgi:cytochrome c peroxidase